MREARTIHDPLRLWAGTGHQFPKFEGEWLPGPPPGPAAEGLPRTKFEIVLSTSGTSGATNLYTYLKHGAASSATTIANAAKN